MKSSRKKIKHIKVRTGCVTCKERKIKCTEEKPSCQKCTRSGQQCGGYNIPKTWLFQPRRERDLSTKEAGIRLSPPWNSVLLPDEADRRSFNFYIDQTAPILSAYFGYSFWSRTLPQVSLHEPVIREMVLATSSLIESNELHLSLLQDNLVYQTNYRRVLRRMTSDNAPRTEYFLMACLLLACCEFCLGEFQTGMQHVISGIRILDEWYRSKYLNGSMSTSEASLILIELGPLFASIIQKIPTYSLALGLHPGMMLKLAPSRELPRVPETFSNIHQARHTMDGIAHNIIQLMDAQHDLLEQSSSISQFKNSLSTYSKALRNFEAQMPWLKRDRLAVWISLLRAHHIVLEIVVNGHPFVTGSLASYEPFQLEFEAILDEYTTTICAKPRQDICFQAVMPSDSDRLQWHFGFIPPLFFVATKCPRLETRYAAIVKLRSLGVQEKHWNSCVAASVAEALLNYEDKQQSMALSYIPQISAVHSHLPCSLELECGVFEHLVEVSGYQGATKTLPTNCACIMTP